MADGSSSRTNAFGIIVGLALFGLTGSVIWLQAQRAAERAKSDTLTGQLTMSQANVSIIQGALQQAQQRPSQAVITPEQLTNLSEHLTAEIQKYFGRVQ